MKLDTGKHNHWRELSLRIHMENDTMTRYEYFIELNLWAYFVTLSFKGRERG